MTSLIQNKVALTEFKLCHVDLLSGWLQQPHVKPWYPDPNEDLENARKLCADSGEVDQSAGQFLILIDSQPVGYARWQLVPKAVLDDIGLIDIPDNSADVDLLIGEQSQICKGAGSKVLAAMEDRLSARGDVPIVGLTTSKKNHYAHRAFEKSGYKVAAEYSPDGYGDCYLYTKELS